MINLIFLLRVYFHPNKHLFYFFVYIKNKQNLTLCNSNTNCSWSRSGFPLLKFLWYFDLFSSKCSYYLWCSIFLYSLFKPSLCRRSTFYRDVLCYSKMATVNFMNCFYWSTICTLTHKADDQRYLYTQDCVFQRKVPSVVDRLCTGQDLPLP